MPFSKYKRFIIFTVATLSFCLTSSAKLEQTMLSINENDKKVTFTLYHFDASKQVSLSDLAVSVGVSATQQSGEAAISAAGKTDFSYKSGKFIFAKTTTDFIKNGAILNPVKSPRSSKRTFILTDEKGQHAIGYAPSTNETEFGYALQKYLASSKIKFTRVVVINSGSQCSFYKENGKYNPYYLKELKKPAKVIVVK